MAHHDRSVRERVIALAEEGRLSASTAGELVRYPEVYCKSMATEIPEGWASWRGYDAYPAQLRMMR
jgi:hypothetical protein